MSEAIHKLRNANFQALTLTLRRYTKVDPHLLLLTFYVSSALGLLETITKYCMNSHLKV